MGLNKEQAEAVHHKDGPMLVLAGPGSGKTHTLVERIRYLIEIEHIPPSEILTITFSKKAALEMQARFIHSIGDNYYPVSFSTFHACFYHILKQYRNYSVDSVLTPKSKIEYIKSIGDRLAIKETQDEAWVSDIMSKIGSIKNQFGKTEEIIATICPVEKDRIILADIYKGYEELKHRNNKIDYDDMIQLCLRLLKENQDILYEWQNIYRYFLVDEFQDINNVQYEVLKLLAGDRSNIFAVGDDDQSIYGFRGSNPEIMKRFIDEHNNCSVVNLVKNYRSSEAIIKLAGNVIKNNINRIEKMQISARKNNDEGIVQIKCFATDNQEAEYVTDTVVNLIEKGVEPKNVAILYRTSRCANLIEEKLISKGIFCNRKTDRNGFYDSEWMLDLIAYYRIALKNPDRSYYYRILNKPYRNLSRELIYENPVDVENMDKYCSNNVELKRFIYDIRRIAELPPFLATNYILKAMGYGRYLQNKLGKMGYSYEKINDIQKEIIEKSKCFSSLEEWLFIIDNMKPADNEKFTDERKGVIFQTVHASKGLEYDTVFIVGLQEGLFPHNKAYNAELIEEERRLMYVAITRARNNLYICGLGEKENAKRISRFYYEADAANTINENK